MLLQTSIYSSILNVTASNFQEMLLRDSKLKWQYKLDFDEQSHQVPFVISLPIYIAVSELRCILSRICGLVGLSYLVYFQPHLHT